MFTNDLIQGSRLPKLVVFDLDFTLWKPELYQLSGSPFRRDKTGRILDKRGTEILLFPGVDNIIRQIKSWGNDTKIGIASRTDEPEWAAEVLSLMEIDNVPLRNYFDFQEIYPGSKITHFHRLNTVSGIPFNKMIFFDDWDLNCNEVSRLGVVCIECPAGLNTSIFELGLQRWKVENSGDL
eukprot:gene5414-10839_t